MSKTENKTSIQREVFKPLGLGEVGLTGVAKKKLVVGFSTWVRVLQQNWRQGTVACKDRSEVNRTNKKPWKQKGTGRARAGSARSPLWRGGGVIFGPQARVRTLTVSQKLKSAVLRNFFIDHIEKNNVIVADWMVQGDKPSTSQSVRFLHDIGLANQKVTLLLPWSDDMSRLSFGNIARVQIVLLDQLNAYDLAHANKIVLLKKDLQQFKEMVAKWS